MAFRFDQLTLKSQEAVQKAQALAQERGHQRLEPMHLLAALLDPEQAVVRSLLSQLGVNPAQILRAAEEGLDALPKVTGGETTLGPDLNRVLEQAQAEADRMKDQYVSVEHLLLGLDQGQEPGAGRCSARSASPRRTSSRRSRRSAAAQQVTDQNPEDKYQALEKYGRDLVELARNGQDGPGHRPRLRDPPGRPGPQPADQEQPGPDRRAGRRQDGDRRGPGAADRLGRRPREPPEPQGHRARHGGAGRRDQVPRRVRGAAQGGAQGRHRSRRGGSSCSSTSCTWSSARARPRARWTPPTCSSRPWRAASCAASAPRRSTSTASTSRRTPRSSGGSSRSSSASRRSRTRSRSSAA